MNKILVEIMLKIEPMITGYGNTEFGLELFNIIEKDMSNKYFRKEYTKDFSEATFIHAE